MDVARTQRRTLQIVKLVEHEQRMLAGAGTMTFTGTAFLRAARLAHATVDVQHDGRNRLARVNPIQMPDRSDKAAESASRVSQDVSKRPI